MKNGGGEGHARQALADVEAQRDDTIVYLSAIRSLLAVVARGQGVTACAQEIAQVLVRELGIETCVLAVRGEDVAPAGQLAVAGIATQTDHLGGPTGEAPDWLAVARLAGSGSAPSCLRREPDGALAPTTAAELAGEGCLVLPLAVAGETTGVLLLHWLVAPSQVFGRAQALAMLGEIVGQALTVAHVRDSIRRLCGQLESELGVARRVLSVQEESLRSREENIETLTAALIRSNRVKREFLGTVSHELRTPLNAILGYTSLLREGAIGPVSAEQSSALDRVLGSTRNLNALIDDILFFIQVEADRVLLRPEPTDTDELVGDVLGALVERPAPDQVALRVEVAPEAARLTVDVGLMRRILFHLVSNAFKFTARGEIVLTVRAGGERGSAVVSVRDTGSGIPADRIEEIFDLFTQADGSTTRRHNGLGMGLTLVQRCVRLLGGEVQVESAPGEGSEFRVHLPGVVMHVADDARPYRSLH